MTNFRENNQVYSFSRAKISSAVAATSPPTMALAFPKPIPPRNPVRVHSISSTSPGVTFRRNLASLTPPKRTMRPRFSGWAQESHATHLGHGFQNQHAGHDMLLGEVAAEKRLIDGDTLDALGPLAGSPAVIRSTKAKGYRWGISSAI